MEVLDDGHHGAFSNITAEEKRALSDLENDEDHIFKPSDKGGNLVVLNHVQYRTMVLDRIYYLINNTMAYCQVTQLSVTWRNWSPF